jgi:hypothetical protein
MFCTEQGLEAMFEASSDILAALRVPSKRASGRLNLQCRSSIPESLSIIEINLHKMEESLKLKWARILHDSILKSKKELSDCF